jgi:regulator of protease activity HflC (stomatin/prohibitin superfamily)
LQIDGVLYLRVKDPYDASYGVTDPIYALEQLAQTTMRSELVSPARCYCSATTDYSKLCTYDC